MGTRLASLILVSALLVGVDVDGAGAVSVPTTAALDTDVAARAQVATPMPFSMVGFSVEPGEPLWFRTSLDGAAWTAWIEAEALEEDPRYTEPVWVGQARWVEASRPATAHLIDSAGIGRSLRARAADALRASWAGRRAEAAGPPGVISRAGWGADESWRRGPPRYSDQVRASTLHHTAGTNAYSAADTPAIVRGIYRYHTGTLGWNDIGYHLLVDRYGRVYEGRAGGLDRPVIGAHAGGFNSDTFGLAVLGEFTSHQPPRVALDAVVDTIAWKFAVHRIDPRGTARLTSRGSTRYPSGHEVTLPTLFGHRDVSRTTCPGDALYPLLPDLRRRVADAMPGVLPSLGLPVTGDWNGDGVDTPGWFRDGRWVLQRTATGGLVEVRFGGPGDLAVVGDWNGDGRDSVGVRRGTQWLLRDEIGTGNPDRRFHFGLAGDVPVVGDWNGDGRDGIGIFRAGAWHVRNHATGGPADLAVSFGRPGDVPVAGDWNGNGRDSPGVVRGNGWLLRHRLAAGPPDRSFTHGGARDLPVAGRWWPARPDGVGAVSGSQWRLRSEVAGVGVITSRRWGE